jgi:hypothetical protein
MPLTSTPSLPPLPLLPPPPPLLFTRFDIYLNFFNDALDWPLWLSEHQQALGGGIVAEVHIYHAFDPPAPDRCAQSFFPVMWLVI